MASVFLHLASLSMINSRCTHAAAQGTISFFSWLSGTPLCVCTASPLSIQHLSVDVRWRPRLGHCEQCGYERGGGGGACIRLARKVVRVLH